MVYDQSQGQESRQHSLAFLVDIPGPGLGGIASGSAFRTTVTDVCRWRASSRDQLQACHVLSSIRKLWSTCDATYGIATNLPVQRWELLSSASDAVATLHGLANDGLLPTTRLWNVARSNGYDAAAVNDVAATTHDVATATATNHAAATHDATAATHDAVAAA